MKSPKPKPELSESQELDPLEVKQRRLGFMKGEISVPDDFDTLFSKEIEEMFYGSE
jgi:hypothetical protein